MAMTASDSSDSASDTHARALPVPFSSRLCVRVSPLSALDPRLSLFADSRVVAVLAVAVLSRLAASAVARLSLCHRASCLSVVRLRSGGVPVTLSVGCVVSNISVTLSTLDSWLSALSSHAVSHSFSSRSAWIAVLSSRWLSAVAVCICSVWSSVCCSDAAFFCVAQLVLNRAVVSMRAGRYSFNRIGE